jgi:hypothetical protein
MAWHGMLLTRVVSGVLAQVVSLREFFPTSDFLLLFARVFCLCGIAM